MPSDDWHNILPPMLQEAGLVASSISDIAPLTGGVSSDIIRFRTDDGRQFCAKRALSKLKVAEDWTVPLERNSYEVAWLRRANSIIPGAAPQVIADSAEFGTVILEFLPPEQFDNWKSLMLAGDADPDIAATVGATLGHLHAATSNDPEVAETFATDSLFDALRLDPYLRFTATVHLDLSEKILAVLAQTAATQTALVHGDFSPKNILIRKSDNQPVILDAECAWYGDPAFDAAFCLNHFLLKAAHIPQLEPAFLTSAIHFYDAWIACFPPQQQAMVTRHVLQLLPCLLLARIDGKSPAEYLTTTQRTLVRSAARELISQDHRTLAQLISDFAQLVQNK
ncbi:phosphotransferase family protein [Parasedimentitalea psychrophila]|uniref:Aminoglycoside phosphotransferase family protein n=1 Tax=Parasedimentitalea psychrophila TaxID=2997337 RepID=A0A9Y2KZT0_9RHOB|nr:aminoglycoside phosphotransferase family protein [Parasedimentitalea psychrophila]WIY24757.1 aminoglycoside phosphotransferase family protein [Parasedimentitalea psychrophila]